MKRIIYFLFILLLSNLLLNAQTTKDELLSDTRYIGGLYCPYIYENPVSTPAPEAYKPFYISHYGRHGSRWTSSPDYHMNTIKILNRADEDDKLTEIGRRLFQRIKIAAEDARDRYGDLAPLGVREEKDIAERMYLSSPEVFSTEGGRRCSVYSRSTQVARCILSMAANNERLKEFNPEIEMWREATKRNGYLNNDADINSDTVRVIVDDFLQTHFNPKRFIESIFTDTLYANNIIENPAKFAYWVYYSAINLANIDYLNLSMYDVFTDDELFVLWQVSNLNMYLRVGPSALNGEAAIQSAVPLLKDIIDCADKAIKNKDVSADLRFGHDTYIIPLLALMDIKGMNVKESDPEKVYLAWSNFKASPMGTNLLMIFYSSDDSDDILVKFLLCEKETEIPISTDIAPYYNWKDVRAYYKNKF